MTKTFTTLVAKNQTWTRTGASGLSRWQPENPVDFSSGSKDGVRFAVTVEDIVGSADEWDLFAKFQIAQFGAGPGAPNTHWNWYDLQDGPQKQFMLPEGDFESPEIEITNLSPNPTLDEDAVGWAHILGGGGTGGGSLQTSGGYRGDNCRRLTWTGATSTPSGGQYGPVVPVSVGQPITAGIGVKESRTQRVRWGVRWDDGTYTWGPSQLVPGGLWVYGGIQIPSVPAGKTSGRCIVEATGGTGASNREIGDWQEVDAHMVSAGINPIRYIDGTEIIPGKPLHIASKGDPFPITKSRLIRGFGRWARLELSMLTSNPSEDFGFVLSITTD